MNVPISVLMVSGGSPDMSAAAVKSLRENTNGEFQLVFIDNGSDKAEKLGDSISPLLIRQDMFVRNETKVSFARANNQAAGLANGSYLLLLNNDTVTSGDWQKPLLTEGVKYGVCGPTVRQMVVVPEINALICYNDKGKPLDAEPEVDGSYVEGWCLFTSREHYEKLNGLDEVFWPMFCEDSDFCFRAKRAGAKLGKVSVPIKHIGSVDTNKYIPSHYREAILMSNSYKMYARWIQGAIV